MTSTKSCTSWSVIFSLKNRYANKAEKRAAVLKIITTFATVVVFTAVMKNILESPIKKAQILNIKKGDVLKAFFIYSFLLRIKLKKK